MLSATDKPHSFDPKLLTKDEFQFCANAALLTTRQFSRHGPPPPQPPPLPILVRKFVGLLQGVVWKELVV